MLGNMVHNRFCCYLSEGEEGEGGQLFIRSNMYQSGALTFWLVASVRVTHRLILPYYSMGLPPYTYKRIWASDKLVYTLGACKLRIWWLRLTVISRSEVYMPTMSSCVNCLYSNCMYYLGWQVLNHRMYFQEKVIPAHPFILLCMNGGILN